MKKLITPIVLATLALSMTGCTSRVQPNEIGVLMTNYGRNGVSDYSIIAGRVWTFGLGTQLWKVPTYEQRGEMEKTTLKASDNTEFYTTPIYSYKVNKEKAVELVFENSQLGGGFGFLDALEDNSLEVKINDILKEQARLTSTESIMANGGTLAYEEAVTDRLKELFTAKGLELISFSSQLEFSAKVTEKIDSRNQVNTNLSVLDQQIEEQKKKNELKRLELEALQLRSQGLSPQILTEQFLNKWDGKLPTYTNEALPSFIINNLQ